ncbi:MAG: DUF2157 domain-containing protein [Pseudomonadota bacterium]
MSESQAWREAAATQAALRGWRREGRIDAAVAARAHAALGGDPSPSQWRWFLDRSALWLGVALCAAGAICFIAANWDELGKFARLFGLQAALVLATLAAARLGPTRVSGQAALWLATLLLGGLLALIGQTYQTGADMWELFALWAVLALPWAIAGRSPALWWQWLLLANVAYALWLGLHRGVWFGHFEAPAAELGLFNALLLMLWHAAGTRWAECSGSTGRRLLAAAMVAFLSFAAMDAILGREDASPMPIVLWLLATLIAGAAHLRLRRDLVVLATLALGTIAVVTAALVEALLEHNDDSAIAYLAIAVAVVAQATVAAMALRRLARGEAA